MAYSFQAFTDGNVATATQRNQTEVNVRDHVHGTGGVSTIDVANSLTSVLYSGSSVVAGNSLGLGELATVSSSHRYYMYSAYIGAGVVCINGVGVTAAEAVTSSIHVYIIRDANGAGDGLRIINGGGTSQTIVWKANLLNS